VGRALSGRSFEGTDRRGKFLFLAARDGGGDGPWLVLHLGMTGRVTYEREPEGIPDHSALLVDFEGGARMTFVNVRKLGRVDLTASPGAFASEHDLGPDALSIGRESFVDSLARSRAKIKGALMDQSRFAGVGNIYADEILFQVGVDPRTPASDLSDDRLRELWRVMRRVLRTAVSHEARLDDLPGGYLLPHRSKGEECPRGCGSVEKITVVGRATYLCSSCQRRG
jgi:formamidopyrimidine-DNA glycosylase